MEIPKVIVEPSSEPCSPLFVQSEFDLRAMEVAADAVAISQPSAQSDPNLGESSGAIFSGLIETSSLGAGSSQVIASNRAEAGTIHEDQATNPASIQLEPAAAAGVSALRNQSELEINAQHYRIQKQYKKRLPERKRRLTDIDFEGILKIIGGCNTWQILIYLMISAHQVPHAMFNLSVVYFSFASDHWCKVPVFSREYIENLNKTNEVGAGWSWEKALDSGIAFPQVKRHGRIRHDRCSIYKMSEEQYREYIKMDFQDSLGYLVGCLMGGFISDRYGRKPAIYGFSILSTIFGFLLSFSQEFEVFLVVRFLLAACNEAADLAAYVYCMEITGMQYRSIVGSMLQAPWACGYAFLALVAYLCRSWTSIQLITSTMHFCSLFLIHFLPESPRWLIVTNRVDEAEKIIRKACHFNKSSLPSDLELVRHAELRKWIKQNARPHFLHSFKSQAMAFRNVIIFIVWIATALVYYGIVIALSDQHIQAAQEHLIQSTPGRAMFVGNFFLNNAIAGAIEIPTLMFCAFLLHSGRKRSQVITLISSGVLIFIAMCLSMRGEMTFSLIFMLLGKACIQGAFNILYIFTSELYPTIIRNSAVGTCSLVARIGSAASGYIAILSDVTLPIVPMAIFCVFSLFAGVLIYFLPETRDLPLPDTMWDAIRMLKNTNAYRCAGVTVGDASADEEEEDEYDDANESDNAPLYTNVSKR